MKNLYPELVLQCQKDCKYPKWIQVKYKDYSKTTIIRTIRTMEEDSNCLLSVRYLRDRAWIMVQNPKMMDANLTSRMEVEPVPYWEYERRVSQLKHEKRTCKYANIVLATIIAILAISICVILKI